MCRTVSYKPSFYKFSFFNYGTFVFLFYFTVNFKIKENLVYKTNILIIYISRPNNGPSTIIISKTSVI